MAGYQFIHLEGYARRAGKGKSGGHSCASIAAEAERDPGACPHVEDPDPPRRIFGISPREAATKAETWSHEAKDSRGHKMRQDGLCLVAGVISVPPTLKDWDGYKEASMAFLEGFYGPRLESVVEHTDEKERHLHFYAVPLPGERFEILHPGRAAAAEAKARGELKGDQNKAYKASMRAFQIRFWEEVGSRFGLTRMGPGRRRLTRAEWKAEQKAQELLQCELEKAEMAMAKAQASETEMGRLRAEVEALRQELAAAKAPNQPGLQIDKEDFAARWARSKIAGAARKAKTQQEEPPKQEEKGQKGPSF